MRRKEPYIPILHATCAKILLNSIHMNGMCSPEECCSSWIVFFSRWYVAHIARATATLTIVDVLCLLTQFSRQADNKFQCVWPSERLASAQQSVLLGCFCDEHWLYAERLLLYRYSHLHCPQTSSVHTLPPLHHRSFPSASMFPQI